MKLITTIVLLFSLLNVVAADHVKQNDSVSSTSNSTKNNFRFDLTQKIIQENVTGESVAGDKFGYSVDIDNDYAIAGMPDSYGYGKVNIYHNNGTDWVLEQSILSEDFNQNAESLIHSFGFKVFIENDRAVIAANYINTGGIVVFIFHKVGNEWIYEDRISSDDLNTQLDFILNSGENGNVNIMSYSNQRLVISGFSHNASSIIYGVFAFELNNNQWEHASTVTMEEYDTFIGLNLNLDNDRLIVGSPYKGDNNQGLVYIYDYNGISWTRSNELIPSISNPNDYFGLNVAIHGDKALIQASENEEGAVYYFELLNSAWVEMSKITYHPDDTYNKLGSQIDLFDNKAMITVITNEFQINNKNNLLLYTLINDEWILDDNINISLNVSSISFDTSNKFILGDIKGSDNDSGNVFIYRDNNTPSWEIEKQFDRPIRNVSQHFGKKFSVDGNNAFIGTHKDISRRYPRPPPTLDNIVYVFKKSGDNWTQTQAIIPPEPSYEFGSSISVEGDTAVISASDLEKVYVYKLINNIWELVATLTDDTNQSIVFGLKVAISQNKVLVTAYKQDDFEMSSLHVFEANNNSWIQTYVLNHPISSYTLLDKTIDFSGNSIAVISFDQVLNESVLFSYDFDGTNWVKSPDFNFTNTRLTSISSLSLANNRIVVNTITLSAPSGAGSLTIFDKSDNLWQQTGIIDLEANSYFYVNYNPPLIMDNNIIALSIIPPSLDTRVSNNTVIVFTKVNDIWQSEVIDNNGSNYKESFGHFIELNNNQLFINIPNDDENGNNAGALNVYNKVDIDLIYMNGFE